MSSNERSQSPNAGPYFEQLGIDPIVHEPARLIILMILHAAVDECDFRFLLKHTEQSPGNLSAQAIKLEQAGYISIKKSFLGRHSNSKYQITPEGTKALETYWQRMEAWKRTAKSVEEIEAQKERLKMERLASPEQLPGIP